MHKPLVKSFNHDYSKQLLQSNGYNILRTHGLLHEVEGFDDYNQLLKVNRIFSSTPRFDPVDRTGQIAGPIFFEQPRMWQVPHAPLTLERALELRVQDICNLNRRINIFWSGGIDSTTIAVAFIKHAPDIARCRIIYSPWSTYEHPDFFKLLIDTGIEMVDISGDIYFSLDLDGVFVSGNTGDEIHASLDHSFFQEHGPESLHGPWQDLFRQHNDQLAFVDWCERFFSAAGRPIRSVLEARWWFYTSTKLTSLLNTIDLSFLCANLPAFDPQDLLGFFDCDHYERFIYYNLDKILSGSGYETWKQHLKDYCCSFDQFEHWRATKTKFHSSQLGYYTGKLKIMQDKRNLMLLSNGERVATPNLPLFSRKEWQEIADQYQHVFRSID